MNIWWTLGAIGYILVFFLAVGSLFRSRNARSSARPPVAFKLLRDPGASVRRKLQTLDDKLVPAFLGAAAVPLVVTGLLLGLLPGQPGWLFWPGTVGLLVVAVACTVGAGWWMREKLRTRRDCLLDFLGARAVAEQLATLLPRGYRVFHDVPANTGDDGFNLDHVVVGPTGIALVVSKTRTKGQARPGAHDYEVYYDGKQLVWPWGEDRFGLDETEAAATWLMKWLDQSTGIKLPVKPVLVFPGWWVDQAGRGPITVVGQKKVHAAVEGSGESVLSLAQIDLIVRQLEERCRDIED